MTVRVSNGLANKILSGGAAPAYSAQTSGTLTVGKKYRIHTFVAGDSFTNVGASSNATGVDFVATGTTPTTWTNSSVLTPIGTTGGVQGALQFGFINFYTGPQPSTADAAASGTLLGTATLDGDGTSGLLFDSPTLNAIGMPSGAVWKFTGLAAGTVGWCRFYPAGGDPSILSTTEARIDMSCAVSGADMDVSNVSVTVGSPHTIDTYDVTFPLA